MIDYTRWVSVTVDIVDIKSMTDKHIDNCISMIENGKQKNGATISSEWLVNHGVHYLRQFKVEKANRKTLREVRSIM